AIKQDPACVADKAVRPRHHDAASEDADGRVEPRPREKFPGDERSDGGERRKGVGQDVKIRRAQIEIMMMSVLVMIVAAVCMGMAMLVVVSQHECASQVHE